VFSLLFTVYNIQASSLKTSRFLVSNHDEMKQLDDLAVTGVLHRIEACKVLYIEKIM
jgi:hypothetical protein